MIIFILSIILLYVTDILLIGIAFAALKDKYNWNLSPKKYFFLLFAIFALYDSLIIPMFLVLDATLTVRNEAIVQAFDLDPNFPLVELFDLGMYEFITWLIQAFLAGLIGDKLLNKKLKENI